MTGFAGALLLSTLLCLLSIWLSRKWNFYHLPPPLKKERVTVVQTVVTFFIYLVTAVIVVPLVKILFGYFSPNGLSQNWLKWTQFISLWTILFVIIGYLYLINPKARHQVFWGEGKASWRRFGSSLGIGALTWLISYPFVLLVSTISSQVSNWIWGEGELEQVAVEQLKESLSHPLLSVAMIFAVSLLVPFLEELLFRGFLQSLLRKYLGRIWGLVVTGVIFALVHFAASQGAGNFQLILSLFVLSLFLGFLYEREQTIWAPFALHATFNGLTALWIALF